MSDQDEPIQIDPRKVERYRRYLTAYARLHAQDPLEHQRRYLLGLRFLSRLRLRGRLSRRPVLLLLSQVEVPRRIAAT